MNENDYFCVMKHSDLNGSSFIDFHAHQEKHADREDIIEVISSSEAADHQWFTLERHPWTVSNQLSAIEKKVIRSTVHHSRCFALGEIGLDKMRGIEFEGQVAILKSLLEIANQERISVVIHCVKSFAEIIQLKKEFPHIPNWAIHGFNKNPEMAKQLIENGFYLSLNVGKLKSAEAVLRVIPLDRLFLETDNSSELIEENYIRTAKSLGIALHDLKKQIVLNAKQF